MKSSATDLNSAFLEEMMPLPSLDEPPNPENGDL
jgi:hypothetical protein